jgi:plastocyanin
MATFVLGASLVAAVPPAGGTAGLNPEALAALPGLTARNSLFEQPTITARVGETVMLRLDNAATSIHYFDIDAFDVHVPMPSGESAVALFKPTAPGTYTFYCSVPGHREFGMQGTMIVEL